MSQSPTPISFAVAPGAGAAGFIDAAVTSLRGLGVGVKQTTAVANKIVNRVHLKTVKEKFMDRSSQSLAWSNRVNDLPNPPDVDRGVSIAPIVINKALYDDGNFLVDAFVSTAINNDGFRKSSDLISSDVGISVMISLARANSLKFYGKLLAFNSFCAGHMYCDPTKIRPYFESLVAKGWHIISSEAAVLLDERNLPIAGVDLDICHDAHRQMYFDDLRYFSLTEEGLKTIRDDIFGMLMDRSVGNASMVTIQSIKKNGEMETTEDDLEGGLTANSTFYPWMDGMSIREYFMDFFNSNASVMVLYGPPGTAKSTMIRTAIKDLGLRALGTSNANVSDHPAFISSCGSRMSGGQGESPFDLLIAEDAEAMVRPRDQGNANMAALLDATDGIGSSHKFKLIITLNARDLDNVDQALLRPGRCFDIMEFGTLDEKEAAVVRRSLGMPDIAIQKGQYVLAEVVNMDDTKSDMIDGRSIVRPRFGLKKAKA